MDTLAFILLALLTRGAASDLDLAAQVEKNLRAALGEVGRIEVQVRGPQTTDHRPQTTTGRPLTPDHRTPDPGFQSRGSVVPWFRGPVSGQLGQIQVRLHQVDVTRLPLQRFLPQPRERILKGRVERLVFDATEARLNDLPLTRFVITVTDLRFDLLYALKEHDFRITDVDEARVEAMITARDLEAYLSARMPPIKEPHLELSLEGIHLTAHADFGLLEAPLELTGRLAMAPPKEVHLLDSQLWLNKLPVPAALARTLLGKINPLLDLDQLTDLPLPILLEELEAQPGQVVFRGHLETKGDHEIQFPW